jgi:hypothetical protein
VALDDELSCATQRDDVAPPAGSRCMQLQWGEKGLLGAGRRGWYMASGPRRAAACFNLDPQRDLRRTDSPQRRHAVRWAGRRPAASTRLARRHVTASKCQHRRSTKESVMLR